MFKKPEVTMRMPTRRESDVNEPTKEQIRRRAYEIYQSRGGSPGHELEDWLQAEREVRGRREPGAT